MRELKIIYYKDPAFEKCPECGEIKLHRSRSRNVFEKFFKRFTFFKIYRCKGCGWRGYRSTLTITVESFKDILVYVILLAITAVFVLFVIKKFLH